MLAEANAIRWEYRTQFQTWFQNFLIQPGTPELCSDSLLPSRLEDKNEPELIPKVGFGMFVCAGPAEFPVPDPWEFCCVAAKQGRSCAST